MDNYHSFCLFSFPGGASSKESTCNAGDAGDEGQEALEEGIATHSSILAWRIPWTEWGVWWVTVHGVTKSQTQLKWLNTHATLWNWVWGPATRWVRQAGLGVLPFPASFAARDHPKPHSVGQAPHAIPWFWSSWCEETGPQGITQQGWQ